MASTYLDRTPSAGNRKKWTFSAWFKKSTSSASDMGIFTAGTSGNDEGTIKLYNYIDWIEYDSGTASVIGRLTTTQVLRDTSAWYHLVCVWDSANATAGDRMKMYLNGEEVTSFSTDTNPTLNYDSQINNGVLHNIGRQSWNSSGYFDGSMTHVHFTDGTAYTPSAFGETDATTGIWKPKTAPSVTYGTNGFFLKFENSGAFGTDSSGNGNNFTVNGTMTQTIDTPSNVFATLNPLDNATGVTFGLANGNTTLNDIGAGDNDKGLRATLGVSSGKYYWEVKKPDIAGTISVLGSEVDIRNGDVPNTATSNSYHIGSNGSGSSIVYWENGTFVNTSALQGWTNNDIMGVALDMDNGKLFLSINGVFKGFDNNSSDPVAGTNANFTGITTDGTIFIPYVEKRGTGNPSDHFNFGNGFFGTTAVSSAQNPDDGIGIFEYDVPTGYRALCTKSINAEEYS